MNWGRFFHMDVKLCWNGPRNCSVRNVVIEFNGSLLRIPETALNTVTKYHDCTVTNMDFGKEVMDALWFFLKAEYGWA